MKIKTIKDFAQSKFKEKESLFFGLAFPVENIDEAEAKLDEIRKKYYDATHHCYAYKTLSEGEKYSDDGEPSGTAGIRLLNAINHFDLTNVLLVSVRWFGGKKLGVGPLGKAYYRSGLETLENAEIIELEEYLKISVEYDYSQTKNVHHFLQKYGAIIKENLFEEKPKIIALIKTGYFENFHKELFEASARTVKIEKMGRVFVPLKAE